MSAQYSISLCSITYKVHVPGMYAQLVDWSVLSVHDSEIIMIASGQRQGNTNVWASQISRYRSACNLLCPLYHMHNNIGGFWTPNVTPVMAMHVTSPPRRRL